ncbi:unnamed protein product [Staurois parvus]|uniref:Uncharacterized protein n=1 Tax=Staurois parvus TaxID=386267 RepID=A0ABN9BCL6_9NEOB|nr:unnamed protein product [Staurois parvus]
MDTDRWRCWSYTDHQGTLIISALMICVHLSAWQLERREMPITGISLFTRDQL